MSSASFAVLVRLLPYRWGKIGAKLGQRFLKFPSVGSLFAKNTNHILFFVSVYVSTDSLIRRQVLTLDTSSFEQVLSFVYAI